MRPRSGLILGKAIAGEAASGGGPRTSGVAALMAGAARGRVPDACGAIVAAGSAVSAAAPAALHNSTGAPGTRHPLAPSPERANHPRVLSHGAPPTRTASLHYGKRSIDR